MGAHDRAGSRGGGAAAQATGRARRCSLSRWPPRPKHGRCRTTSGASGKRPRRAMRSTTRRPAATAPLSGADVDAAVVVARAAQPAWRQVPPQERARAVLALRTRRLLQHRQELTALVTATWDTRRRRWRGRPRHRVGRIAAAIPHLLKGETLAGGRLRHRCRADPPARRCGRGDHPVQLPGDVRLVPALRLFRLRKRLRAEAVGSTRGRVSGSAS